MGSYFPRTILLVWGVNKITKKLVRPWASASNELLDFLSRVPDSLELEDFRTLPDTQVTLHTTLELMNFNIIRRRRVKRSYMVSTCDIILTLIHHKEKLFFSSRILEM